MRPGSIRLPLRTLEDDPQASPSPELPAETPRTAADAEYEAQRILKEVYREAH